jgi:hypothetical protein
VTVAVGDIKVTIVLSISSYVGRSISTEQKWLLDTTQLVKLTWFGPESEMKGVPTLTLPKESILFNQVQRSGESFSPVMVVFVQVTVNCTNLIKCSAVTVMSIMDVLVVKVRV